MVPPKQVPGPKFIKLGRFVRLASLAVFFILVVVGALSVPFIYESQTLWYKLGLDKTLLRVGKMAGLFSSVLLLVQVLLAVRGEFLEDLWGIRTLMLYHRINGLIVLFFACIHVLLILVPEGMGNLPLGMKYLPEMVGVILLFVVLFMVISAYFREQLGLMYVKWRRLHRFLGYSLLFLMSAHILFVSESFEQNLPRVLFLALVLGLLGTVLLIKKR